LYIVNKFEICHCDIVTPKDTVSFKAMTDEKTSINAHVFEC